MGRKKKNTIPATVAGRTKKHGAFSVHTKQLYNDLRTSKGRAMRDIMESLIDDLGGVSSLTAGQQILLSNVRSKLIVLMQISEYVADLERVVLPSGDLPPVLARHFNTFSESVRRDLQSLYASVPAKVDQSYENALKALSGGKK